MSSKEWRSSPTCLWRDKRCRGRKEKEKLWKFKSFYRLCQSRQLGLFTHQWTVCLTNQLVYSIASTLSNQSIFALRNRWKILFAYGCRTLNSSLAQIRGLDTQPFYLMIQLTSLLIPIFHLCLVTKCSPTLLDQRSVEISQDTETIQQTCSTPGLECSSQVLDQSFDEISLIRWGHFFSQIFFSTPGYKADKLTIYSNDDQERL